MVRVSNASAVKFYIFICFYAVPSSPTGVVIDIPSNSSMTVAWDPPADPNGILLNYTVRIYNLLTGYYTDFDVYPFDVHFVSVDDLGKVVRPWLATR